jgi:hypothetical protein
MLNKRLESLEVKQLPEEPIAILVQVVEKQSGEVVIIDEYYLNERGVKYGPYK